MTEQELTQAMASAIEDAIRRHPDQWFCNKRRWPKQKAAAAQAAAEAAAGTPPDSAGLKAGSGSSRG